jgi:hypothetical protein
LNVIFALGFGGSVYGLLKRYNWGRVLFMWLIVIWSGSNLIALFAPNLFYFLFSPNTPSPGSGLLFSPNPDYTAKELTLNGFRFVVELCLPLWYLNLPHIKTIFHTPSAENSTIKGTSDDSLN